MKKLILLDIDGVLSLNSPALVSTKKVVGYSPAEPESQLVGLSEEVTASTIAKVNIPNKVDTHRTHTYRPAVIAALDTMVRSGDVEIRFLTNWGSAAKSIFSAYVGLRNISNMDEDAKSLGVPHLTSVDGLAVNWYKSQAFIREATTRGREVLFVDDLIDLELALAWNKLLPSTAGWLKVNPEKGLTMEWVARIENWLKGGPTIRRHSLKGE